MNISEFERQKPKETYKRLNEAIEKYQSYIREIDPIMDDSDCAYIQAYEEALTDLKDIKNIFLSGK
jgi:hypothetical protein